MLARLAGIGLIVVAPAILAGVLHGFAIRESRATMALFRRVPKGILDLFALGSLAETKREQVSGLAGRWLPLVVFRWVIGVVATAACALLTLGGLSLLIQGGG